MTEQDTTTELSPSVSIATTDQPTDQPTDELTQEPDLRAADEPELREGDDADGAEDQDGADATDNQDTTDAHHATDDQDATDDHHSTAEGEHDDGENPPVPAGGKVRQLEREGEVAADFLETLLDIADLDGDIDVDVDGDRAAVAIVDSDEGRVPRKLIGRDGEVLEALQELTRLAVQSATGERSRLMLDVGGHRAARREALVVLAGTAIDAAKATSERQELNPMTAFERKVVHDAVLAAGLSSESEGVEPHRYVVVLPA